MGPALRHSVGVEQECKKRLGRPFEPDVTVRLIFWRGGFELEMRCSSCNFEIIHAIIAPTPCSGPAYSKSLLKGAET